MFCYNKVHLFEIPNILFVKDGSTVQGQENTAPLPNPWGGGNSTTSSTTSSTSTSTTTPSSTTTPGSTGGKLKVT